MPWIVIRGVAYQLRDREVSVGRAPSCDIVLADDLASRHHATLFSDAGGVSVRDNHSRNGTMLNGERLLGSKELYHLDEIVIGSSQMVFYEQNPAGTEFTPHSNRAVSLDADDDGESQATATLTGTGHMVIGALVARSLDANDVTTAGRIIQNLGQRMMLAAKDRSLSSGDLSACSNIIMRYADVARDGRWVEWVLEIHAVMQEVPSRYTVDVICMLGADGGLDSPRAPRLFLHAVRDLAMTAEQKFLVSRIQSLERQLSA